MDISEKPVYDKSFDLADHFQAAFNYFNGKLFENRLPAIIITVQRHRGALGFFCPESYVQRAFDEKNKMLPPEFRVHEISIMPDGMFERPDREVLSTLVHEMCHLQQQEQGKPSRNGYHNKEWGAYMRDAGLEPSCYGKFDVRNPELSEKEKENALQGAATGQKMSHFIIPGGAFDAACAELLKSGFRLNLQQAPNLKTPVKKSKLKYTCGKCGCNAWAKPGVRLTCGECDEPMTEETDED